MGEIKKILFVCTGNSCRSVMAEAILKKRLEEAGKEDIEVLSAGVGTMGGMSPTRETLDVLKTEGVDLVGFKSTPLNIGLIRNADIILVMEKAHREQVLDLVPEAKAKTHLLKEFKKLESEPQEEGAAIPDPIGKPMEFYRYVMKLIKKEIERIMKFL
jgi:protein-tyrosine-phosphatase